MPNSVLAARCRWRLRHRGFDDPLGLANGIATSLREQRVPPLVDGCTCVVPEGSEGDSVVFANQQDAQRWLASS